MHRSALFGCALSLLVLGSLSACGSDSAGSGGGGGVGAGASTANGGAGGGSGGEAGAPLTGRPYDPLVLVGAQLPGLASVMAGDVVAFARDGAKWKQIPVQVDERVLVDFCQIYAKGEVTGLPACGTTEVIKTLFYADPGTYTGADTDPHLDADDEVVLMARDAGARASGAAEPDGVVAGSGLEVEIADGDERAYAYLFARAKGSGLDPAAGVKLVHYDFSLRGGGDYKTSYPFKGGGNCGNTTCDPPAASLEDSVIKTGRYQRHFAARWVTDELRITTEGSSGDDILDIAQAKFSPDFCGRHVLTFSTAEGAFVANVDGPLRAIRSYLGANSGPLTERTHLFYEGSEVVHTFLRVHEIPGVMDLVDYAPAATGMTYYNEKNTKGLSIDGKPDPSFDNGAFAWDLTTGAHGSVLTRFRHWFSGAFHVSGYYEDDAHTKNDQCNDSTEIHAPDAQAFGTSGLWIDQDIPVTDPSKGGTDYVVLEREQIYGVAGLKETEAEAEIAKPALEVVARRFGLASAPTCGDGTCDAGESKTCPIDCGGFDGKCGDGLCDLWESSVTCAKDCAAGQDPGGSKCGDGTCAVDEQELSCPDDCWKPAFVPVVACFDEQCPIELGTCSADPGCVDLVVCTGNCVAGGGMRQACFDGCVASGHPTSEDQAAGDALLDCGASHACD